MSTQRRSALAAAGPGLAGTAGLLAAGSQHSLCSHSRSWRSLWGTGCGDGAALLRPGLRASPPVASALSWLLPLVFPYQSAPQQHPQSHATCEPRARPRRPIELLQSHELVGRRLASSLSPDLTSDGRVGVRRAAKGSCTRGPLASLSERPGLAYHS